MTALGRMTISALASLILSAPAASADEFEIRPDTAFFGQMTRHSYKGPLEECQAACAADMECHAFVYSSQKTCDFLTSIDGFWPIPGYTSGRKISIDSDLVVILAQALGMPSPDVQADRNLFLDPPPISGGSTLWNNKIPAQIPEQDFYLGFREGPLPEEVPQFLYTEFRGLKLGLPKKSIDPAMPNNLTVKDMRILERGANPEKECGSIGVMKTGELGRMELRLCYFGADGMALEDFAQSLVKNYRIPTLTHSERSMGSTKYNCYVGLSRDDQQISVCEYPELRTIGQTRVIGPTYIAVTVNAPGSGTGPSFD